MPLTRLSGGAAPVVVEGARRWKHAWSQQFEGHGRRRQSAVLACRYGFAGIIFYKDFS